MNACQREWRPSSWIALLRPVAIAWDGGAARAGPVLAGAAAVGLSVCLIVAFLPSKPLSSQMLAHVASMNIAAPIAAIALVRLRPPDDAWQPGRLLWPTTAIQFLLLWGFHLPTTGGAKMSAGAHLWPHAVLFVSATLFWFAVTSPSRRAWDAVLALLLTGKLACLLGTLLVFAPRPLYAVAGALPPQVVLGDQQIAGLIMIAACPLSYVLVAIGIMSGIIRGSASRKPAVLRSP